jgi:hypothetical protein
MVPNPDRAMLGGGHLAGHERPDLEITRNGMGRRRSPRGRTDGNCRPRIPGRRGEGDPAPRAGSCSTWNTSHLPPTRRGRTPEIVRRRCDNDGVLATQLDLRQAMTACLDQWRHRIVECDGAGLPEQVGSDAGREPPSIVDWSRRYSAEKRPWRADMRSWCANSSI